MFKDFPEYLNSLINYKYRAVFTEVTDGDTIQVCADLGFNIRLEMSLRIKKMNAEEAFGKKATKLGKAAKQYVAKTYPVGTPCVVETFKYRKSLNRYLAHVTLNGGVDLATEVIKAGFAVAS